MKQAFLFIILVAPTTFVRAQCEGWNWPEGMEDKAKAYNVQYTDALKLKNFNAARAPLQWLLHNSPYLNTSIYINGARIYGNLIEQETDEAGKEALVDSLMLIYDMRMEHCGEKDEVLARKAYDAYLYMVKVEDKHQYILKLFDEAYELNKPDLPEYMMMPYIDIARRNFKNKTITEEELKQRHDKILESLDRQITMEKDAASKAKLEEMKANISGMVTSDDPVDCNFVKNTLEPKFRGNPKDLEMAKRIFGLMLKAGCTDDPLWIETGELIAAHEPGYGIYKNLGVKAQAAGNLNKAARFYDKALKYAENNVERAELYSRKGALLADRGKYSQARKMYYKALEANPGDKSPYNAIGYLYFNSFNMCAGKKNIIKDRAVFFAAYDMFIKGGNSAMAAKAKAQFPSKTEIFEYNMNVGDPIRIGCWIGERSIIRSRD